jgi:hypothetical protein
LPRNPIWSSVMTGTRTSRFMKAALEPMS